MDVVKYSIDTDMLVRAKNSHYSFDLTPGFWDFLDEQIAKGRIMATMRVYDELVDNDHNDELTKWTKDRKDCGFFVETDHFISNKATRIFDYVQNHPLYLQAHKDEFYDKADPWVIAFADAYGLTVVTHEGLSGGNAKKPKIPNLCDQFSVPWLDPYSMLRELGMRLTYEPTRK